MHDPQVLRQDLRRRPRVCYLAMKVVLGKSEQGLWSGVVAKSTIHLRSPSCTLHAYVRSPALQSQLSQNRSYALRTLPERCTDRWPQMSSDQKIADIQRQLGETVSRIETIQGGRQQPLLSRISSHFKAQSGSLVNVVLTASIFAVAFGRLNQKQQHEVSHS